MVDEPIGDEAGHRGDEGGGEPFHFEALLELVDLFHKRHVLGAVLVVVGVADLLHQLFFVLEMGDGVGFEEPEHPHDLVGTLPGLVGVGKGVELVEKKLVLDIYLKHAYVQIVVPLHQHGSSA